MCQPYIHRANGAYTHAMVPSPDQPCSTYTKNTTISRGPPAEGRKCRDQTATHLLDVIQTGRAYDDRVAILALHQAVVRDPAQGDLGDGQVVRLGDLLDGCERLEVRLVPVAVGVGDEADFVWGGEIRWDCTYRAR